MMTSPIASPARLAVLLLLGAACSDSTAPRNIQIAVDPAEVVVPTGGTQQFTATLSGTNVSAVNWTATGGTITSGGLFTAGNEPGTFAVTATSTVSASAVATAAVEVRPAGVALPVWNRSRAYASSYDDFEASVADSADFSGFAATLFSASGTGSAHTTVSAQFVRDPGTGHLGRIDAEAFAGATNSFPAQGTPNASNHVHLRFEVIGEPVGYLLTADCTVYNFAADLRRLTPSSRLVFEVDITDNEFDDGECSGIGRSGVIEAGVYEIRVEQYLNLPWFGQEDGTSLTLEGGYTMRLEFDRTP
jgi:hypothetical protein